MWNLFKKLFGSAQERRVRKYFRLVTEINRKEESLRHLSLEELSQKTAEFKARFAQGEPLDALLVDAYATCKAVCRQLCGKTIDVLGEARVWDMVPYDVQLVGGIALHFGSIAEMQTGEGKTLTATMPLYLNALAGKPVHLVTVNDYLASRDCAWMGSIFRALGLTTGVLTNDTPQQRRQEIYKADIVYGTASEFGFDYLRDNSMVMRKEDQVQRGFFYALIDEVDSILIDEARTPLIISGPAPESRQMYEELKEPVMRLVRLQRDFCNQLVAEAKRGLQNNAKDKDAIKKLWMVQKGTPRNTQLRHLLEDHELKEAIDQLDIYFHADQNKEEKLSTLAKLYLIVDEKGNEFELTDKGIHAWATEIGGHADDFVMLDLVDEYLKIDHEPTLTEEQKTEQKIAVGEEDARRKERAHNLRQMLRAHLLMEKDVDYMVVDGKIVIVDENTGRPQPGRRFSDGLHQAIEAKEQVPIQKETQTYATITLQNYFRMYEKLGGMTGTAMTEANEFKEIYKLEVLAIPTHRPCLRVDFQDEVYMTEREKYAALLKEIQTLHQTGRPILLGTESVEVSEKLSRILKQYRLEHVVLNAKQNQKEAEVIAMAGRKGAITVATNMAGRGTDIKLQEGVAESGGLAVLGTTRHPSRRIDRQLRGRCARLGDPGSSKFYLSFEDSLMRFFSSPRLTAMLKRFRPPEGEPISASLLTKSIETAQKRIEQRNYTMRKHTLEYDNVMNKQRQEIYAFRNDLLGSDDLEGIIEELIEDFVEAKAHVAFQSRSQEEGWNPLLFVQLLMQVFPVTFAVKDFDDDFSDLEELKERAVKVVKETFAHRLEQQSQGLESFFKTPRLAVLQALRQMMLSQLDQIWQRHLLTMDHLRQDVSLRAVGQKDPLAEFKQEAFVLFDALGERLRTELLRTVFHVHLTAAPQQPSGPFLPSGVTQMRLERRSFAEELEQEGESL